MADITPGKVVLLIIGIIVILVSIYLGLTLILGLGGTATDSICKMNAAMNSLTPASSWMLAPNFACHVKSVDLDSKGSTSMFKNVIGSVEGCSCDDFYGATIDYSPEKLVDNDMALSTKIPIRLNRSEIYFYVYNKTNLTDLNIFFDEDATFNYTIYTKVPTMFWTGFEKCTQGELISSKTLNIGPINCEIADNKGIGVRLELYNFSSDSLPVIINETDIYNESANEIKIKSTMFNFKKVNELQEECILDRESADETMCTPEWEKKWIEKGLAEVAMRCWKMGGKGRLKGTFDCFQGCVYYDSSHPLAGPIDRDDIINALDSNFHYDSVKEEFTPYSQTVSSNNLSIESNDYLEDKKCYFMKYYKGLELKIALIGSTAFPMIIPAKKGVVIISFGNTIEDAREGL